MFAKVSVPPNSSAQVAVQVERQMGIILQSAFVRPAALKRAGDALPTAITNPRRLGHLSLFLFALLRLTILGFYGGFPNHLAIPDAAY
jgi:hypothetical protein